MNKKEEKIIKAIKHELLGMCLDKELEADIDFSKKDICKKLYQKYNFTESEINKALKNYQENSTDPHLYPFEFGYKKYIEDNKIIPLNEVVSFLEYFIKKQNDFYIGYSLLCDLLHPSSEESYEAHRKKALSLLNDSEIQKCKKLYQQYNDITVEIIKNRLKDIPEKSYQEIIKYVEDIFLTD